MPRNFFIISEHSGLPLDIEGGSTDQGAKVITWHHTGAANQQFRFEDDGTIVSVHSGMVLDVEGGANRGHKIIQWPAHGGANQKWKFHKEDGSIRLEGHDLALDIEGGNRQPGAHLVAWSYHGGANQKFRIEKVAKHDAAKDEKVDKKIASLERKLESLRASLSDSTRLQDKVRITLFGQDLRCDKDVRIRVGPVIGKVTHDSAVVLVEVSLSGEVTCFAVPRTEGARKSEQKQILPKNRPRAFHLTGLSPGVVYDIVFEGVNAKDAKNRSGIVRTIPAHVENLRVAVVSCNRPERQLEGETNMWERLLAQVDAGEIDVVFHIGDQVYGQDEFVDAQALLRYSHAPTTVKDKAHSDKDLHRLHKSIKDRMRDIYRYTWNMPYTREVLARVSNLMIWSDNDLYNDFTLAKEDGKALEPVMIHLGQEVYRDYQRALWDYDFHEEEMKNTDEFHYHKYGPVGVFVFDLRGNRITVGGVCDPYAKLVNDAQWHLFETALQDPEIKNFVILAETPFIENDPAISKKNALKPGLEFMVDHWDYNDTELNKLFSLVFDWKARGAGAHDAIFIGGDIHVGVDTWITDHTHNQTIQQLVATPITNHVCDFFPKLEDKFNARFSFVHKPLKNCRNYGLIDCKFHDGKAHINGKLVASAPIAAEKH